MLLVLGCVSDVVNQVLHLCLGDVLLEGLLNVLLIVLLVLDEVLQLRVVLVLVTSVVGL